jgi:hypothetical protein
MIRDGDVANIDVVADGFGMTAIVSSISSSYPGVQLEKSLTIIEWLLTRNPPANVNKQGFHGTAIEWAIGQKRPQIVRLLLNYGANVSRQAHFGSRTILDYSLRRRDTPEEIRQILIAHCANPPTREQICERADAFRVARGEAARGLIDMPHFVQYMGGVIVAPPLDPLPVDEEAVVVPAVVEAKKPPGGGSASGSGASGSGASGPGPNGGPMLGGNTNYYNKYLKYKNKYLQLKSNN